MTEASPVLSSPESAQPGVSTPSLVIASAGDARSTRNWSGTPFFMAAALERQLGRLCTVSPVEAPLIVQLSRLARLQQRFTGWRVMPSASWMAARSNAQTLTTAIARFKPDAVFAPAGSALLAALSTDVPTIYSSDATVALMEGYYGRFTRLSPSALRTAHELEQAAIAGAALLLYPTRWVADSAINDYGADPARVHILPYGANMATVPDRAVALAPRADGPLNLIFVGVDWERKGGDIAVAALRDLNRRGIDARLTIVGCTPPEHVNLDGITVYSFLNKNDPAQAAKLSQLYLESDLLFVPTRAECYGVVWCEAAAHGLPSLSTDTGGVSGAITERVTGHLLPPDADGIAYADVIAGLAGDPQRMTDLRRSARDDFEARLNWDVWARDFVDLLKGVVDVQSV